MLFFVVSVVVIVDTKSPFRPELLILDIVGSWVVNTVGSWVVGPCRILWDLLGPCRTLWGPVGPCRTTASTQVVRHLLRAVHCIDLQPPGVKFKLKKMSADQI